MGILAHAKKEIVRSFEAVVLIPQQTQPCKFCMILDLFIKLDSKRNIIPFNLLASDLINIYSSVWFNIS